MFVGASRIEIHINGAKSLKEKRQVVKSLTDRISHRFNVSVSEIDYHDLRQRGAIGVAHVANTLHDAEKAIQKVTDFAQTNSKAEILRCTNYFFNPEKDYINE